MQVDPAELRAWMADGAPLRLLDVRTPQEAEARPFPEGEPLDFPNSQQYLQLPKDTRIVFACQNGDKALDIAAYFAGHGFTAVRALRGGLDGW